jgi:hypothetical protein
LIHFVDIEVEIIVESIPRSHEGIDREAEKKGDSRLVAGRYRLECESGAEENPDKTSDAVTGSE